MPRNNRNTLHDAVEKAFAEESSPAVKKLAKELYKKPPNIKKSEQTSYKEVSAGTSMQADVLRLPSDKGYNSALVITDIYDRKTDAEPIKNTRSETVLRAGLKIFSRNRIPPVRRFGRIITDGGREFLGKFREHFNKQDVSIVQREVGRHLGVVDRKIQDIGRSIMQLQTNDELKTGKTSKKWVKRLPRIVDIINSRTKQINPHSRAFHIETLANARLPVEPEVKLSERSQRINLLDIGTKVRRVLYAPQDVVDGKRLYGKFRSGDIRWTKSIHTITNILMYPNAPPMYILTGVSEPVHFRHVQRVKQSNIQ